MKDINLSEHFTLEELLESDLAVRHNISEQYIISDAILQNLKKLAINVLEPLRVIIGKPIIVSSGYRCPRVNKAAKGSKTSQHMQGMAADIKVKGMTPEQVFQKITTSGLVFDQCIQEFASKGGWVHISYDSKRLRKQRIIAEKGSSGNTVYTLI